MPRRIALALALVMVLSVWAGFAHIPGARAASPHPEAVLYITPLDGYGSSPGTFDLGALQGDVYFLAEDFGTDTTGVVAIHDLNHTRDHIPDPAANWTVTFQGNENNSFNTGTHYALPLTLIDSGAWNITLTAGGSFTSTTFWVETYIPSIYTDRSVYLPGHHGTAFWQIADPANNSPFQSLTSLQVVANYQTTTGTTAPVPGITHDISINSSGSFGFVVPSDALAPGQVNFLLFANQTSSSAGTNWSSHASQQANVGEVTNLNYAWLNCPSGCPSTPTYAANSPMVLQFSVGIGAYYGAGAGDGLTIHLTFYNGANTVSPPTGTPTVLTTNGSGEAAVAFLGSSSIFSTSGPNGVLGNLSDGLNPALTKTATAHFYLSTSTSKARVQVVLDQNQYSGGDTVTASWSFSGANGSAAVGWEAGEWFAYSENAQAGYPTFADAYITGTATSGTVSFVLPVNYQGTFAVYVEVHNATVVTGNYALGNAVPPTMFLNPSELVYKAGDTVNVAITTVGQVFASATYFETTLDNSGAVVASGQVSGSSFSVMVPSVSPPTSLRYYVVAETAANGVVAQASASSGLQTGYQLSVSLQSASQYSDGSFKPGQSVTISYSLSALGTTKLPGTMMLEVLPSVNFYSILLGGALAIPGASQVTTTSTTGTFSYTLPSSLPDGYDQFMVVAVVPSAGSSCSIYSAGCLAMSQLTVNVESNPPALNYEVGAGSGLTLGWLILFLLIIVVVLVGIVWARRRMGGRSRPPSEPPRPFIAPTGSSPGENSSGAPMGSGMSGDSSPPPMPGGPR